MAKVNLALLGGLRLQTDSQEPVPLSTKKAGALLAYLARHPGQAQARPKLSALLWGDHSEAQARDSLRQALSLLRKALSHVDPRALIAHEDTISFEPRVLTTDAILFEELVTQPRAESLEKAVGLYGGEFLEGFQVSAPEFESWATAERQRLREMALDAMTKLLDHYLSTSAVERGIRMAAQLLAADPLQERVHRTLMELYCRQGRYGAALRQYRTCSDLLAKELGIDPDATTKALRREILREWNQQPGTTSGGNAEEKSPCDVEIEPPVTHRAPERRQVTILVCDLVGASELAARLDPEELQALIGAYQHCCTPIISRSGGAVGKLSGAEMLAYFGHPQAHEHDIESAVRAGLTLVEAVTKLDCGSTGPPQLRVGIATGPVVIGDFLGNGADQHGIIGEAAQLAGSLERVAEPNSVVIAATTRELVGNLFDCNDLGQMTLNGFSEPIPAWRVLGPSGVDSRFEALRTATTSLVGRDEELELLLRRWRQSAHGEGRVVLLSGEPGIGKSRLAVELQEQLQAELHTHLGHFCSPHHQDSALFPIISRLEREAGFQRGDTDQQRLDKLEAVLARATNDLGDAVPPIADLLSVSSGNRYPALDLTPQKRKEKTLRALLGQLEGLAAHHPVLTVFEDVHWIDPTSLELLDLIVDRVPTLPVLVIITCRPEFAPTWIGRPHVTLLTLNRLPPSERAKMIAEVAGGKALPREIADQIIDRTDGVPLFIEELTKTVVESGILVAAGDRYAVTGPGTPLSIPSTLQGSLLARLDRLPATREVAQIGAALGRSFFHELVSAVAEMPQQKLDDALAQLVRAELMFRRGTPPDAEYTFKHALVQDAAYSTFPRSRRQQIHARIATTLETRFPEIVAAQPQLMAQHCTEAGLNEKAVNYRLKAGQQAIARSAMAEAEALLRPGLALIASLPDNDWREEQELDLLITLGRALIATHGWGAPEIGEIYARARELCDRLNRPRKLLPILYGRFVHHALRADLGKAQELAAEMRRLGETQNDVVARVMAYRVSGYASLAFGDFVTARDYLERSLGLYNPTDRAIFAELTPQDIVPTLLSFLACALVCSGHLDQARSRRDAALTEARRLSHAYTSAYAGWWDWHVGWIARSEPGALLQSAEKLLALSVHGRLAFWRAMAIANRGWCLAALGQPEQGIPLVASGLREYHATGNTQFTPLLLTTLADAHRIAGNPQAGLKQLAEAERLAEATRERIVLSETLRLRGDLLLLTDDRGGAEASFTDAIAVARRQAARLFELRATTSLARLWRDQDKCAEARDLLAPVYGWFTEGFDTRDLKEAKALLDELNA